MKNINSQKKRGILQVTDRFLRNSSYFLIFVWFAMYALRYQCLTCHAAYITGAAIDDLDLGLLQSFLRSAPNTDDLLRRRFSRTTFTGLGKAFFSGTARHNQRHVVRISTRSRAVRVFDFTNRHTASDGVIDDTPVCVQGAGVCNKTDTTGYSMNCRLLFGYNK